METITHIVNTIDGFVWGPPMLVAILGTGLFLMLGLKLMPLRQLRNGFKLMWAGRRKGDESLGAISPYQALMTSLAGTVGTGNIAGVATAIFLGGPGAIFWMWMTALVGMATKYAEVLLAVHYREKDASGQYAGGPMYAIKNGLGRKWAWLGLLFALFGGLAGFGIGNMVQVNSMAKALESSFAIPYQATALVTIVIVGLVIFGGIKAIGKLAEAMVPPMILGYVLMSIGALIINADRIPEAFGMIFHYAFNPIAATGGFAGAAVMAAMRHGVARGIFSNEAGMGTAGFAQAAATNNNPVQAGMVGMMGTFIDTIIVCTMTALVIMTSGLWNMGESGAVLSLAAYEQAWPGIGKYLLTIALVVFCFTTVLGWTYISEKCWVFLAGKSVLIPYRVLWLVAIYVGAVVELDFVWRVADVLNGLMAVPNLLVLLLLSPVVWKLTREYFADEQAAQAARVKEAVKATHG